MICFKPEAPKQQALLTSSEPSCGDEYSPKVLVSCWRIRKPETGRELFNLPIRARRYLRYRRNRFVKITLQLSQTLLLTCHAGAIPSGESQAPEDQSTSS